MLSSYSLASVVVQSSLFQCKSAAIYKVGTRYLLGTGLEDRCNRLMNQHVRTCLAYSMLEHVVRAWLGRVCSVKSKK